MGDYKFSVFVVVDLQRVPLASKAYWEDEVLVDEVHEDQFYLPKEVLVIEQQK